jgi:hypothetical protein
LRLLGLRADSGRVLGLNQLKEELLDMARRRALRGGMEWISERLVGRIRFFIGFSGIALDLQAPLEALESALRPYADKLVTPGLGSPIRFSIASMLEDIDLLRGRGDTHLNLWWEVYGADDDLQQNESRRGSCGIPSISAFNWSTRKSLSIVSRPFRLRSAFTHRYPFDGTSPCSHPESTAAGRPSIIGGNL